MDRRLYQACLLGDVNALNALIHEDPLILDRMTTISSEETPLHIATLRGHLPLVKEILRICPCLATEPDSSGQSPLHLAAVKGYVEIVRELVQTSVDAALVRDHEGRMPIHLAAIKGRVDVIRELFRAKPGAARQRLDQGETILHLSVKYNRLEALRELQLISREDGELITSKDDDGNTVLHFASVLKQVETIKFLLSIRCVQEIVDSKNIRGFTARDMVELLPRDLRVIEIQEFLNQVSICRQENQDFKRKRCKRLVLRFLKKLWIIYDRNNREWVLENQNNLMVVATLIAAVAFQAGVNPPGGVWQDFAFKDNVPIAFERSTEGFKNTISISYENLGISHIPGAPILYDMYPDIYSRFAAANFIALISSLGVILLILSGFPLKNKFAMWVLLVTMTTTVSFMAVAFVTAGTGISMLRFEGDWTTPRDGHNFSEAQVIFPDIISIHSIYKSLKNLFLSLTLSTEHYLYFLSILPVVVPVVFVLLLLVIQTVGVIVRLIIKLIDVGHRLSRSAAHI